VQTSRAAEGRRAEHSGIVIFNLDGFAANDGRG